MFSSYFIYDAEPAPIIVFKVEPDELTISNVEELFIILPVTTPVAPVVNIVPVSFGIVIVLSAVGSTTVTVVSNASAVAPSNTIDETSDEAGVIITTFDSTIGTFDSTLTTFDAA